MHFDNEEWDIERLPDQLGAAAPIVEAESNPVLVVDYRNGKVENDDVATGSSFTKIL